MYRLTVRSSPCTGSLQYNQKVEDRNGAGHRSNSIYRGGTDMQFQFVSSFMPRALPTILIPHFFFIYFIVEMASAEIGGEPYRAQKFHPET